MSPEEINLRPSMDQQQSCMSCANWDQGLCQVLQMPTEPTMVSDSWAGKTAAPIDLESMLFGGPPSVV
jgi:hypothetical protein